MQLSPQPVVAYLGSSTKINRTACGDMLCGDESSSCLHQDADNAMKKLLCNVFVGLVLPSEAFAADTAESSGSLLSLLVPLIAVTLGMLAMLWWIKRGKALGGNGPLKVVQAVAVGARERIVVVDAQGRRLVIGVTSSKIELLAELRASETPVTTAATVTAAAEIS